MIIDVLPEASYAAAVALWETTGLTRPWNDPAADLHRAISGPSSTVLAALDSGDLLGTAMVGHDGHRGWVYYLAVHPDHQREGTGRALMQAAERWLRDHGAPKIQLMVRNTNPAATAFYVSLGYENADVAVMGRFLS